MFSNIHYIDLSIIIFYLLACLVLGLSRFSLIKNLREYAIGPRSASTLVLITAIFATKIGAGATIGEIERVYTLGMFFALSLLSTPLFWFITSKFLASNIDKFRDCLTLTDIMRRLYGPSGQWITVIASIVDSIGTVSLQLSALGFLAAYFFDFPREYGIIVGGLVICAYVTFGGARSVVLTDVFQFIIFYAVMPVACVIALKSAGGIEGVVAKLPSTFLEVDLSGQKFWEFNSFIFYSILPIISATFIQRFLMSKNSAQLRYSLNCIGLIAIPFAIILASIGFTIRAVAPEIESNNAFYYLVANYLPTGMVGLSIAAVFAITMSSANSWLNSGATIFANDIARVFRPNMTDQEGLLYARISTVAFAIISIFIAIKGGSVIHILWFTDSIWYPMMLVPVVAGFYGLKTKNTTFAVSASLAVIAACLTAYKYGNFNTVSVCIGIFTSFISFFAMHFATSKSWMKKITSPEYYNKLIQQLSKKYLSRKFVSAQLFEDSRSTGLNYITFCIFIIYQYIPSIFDSALSPNLQFEPLIIIKMSVILFALVFFTFEHWSLRMQKTLAPVLWYFNIFYALCFTSNLMLIVNVDKDLWVINLLLCIILLVLFLPVMRSIIMFVTGAVLAYSVSGYFVQPDHVYNPAYMFETLASLIYGIIGIALIYLVKVGFERKEQQLINNASFVAHEAISPLSLVSMASQTFNQILENAKPTKSGNKMFVDLEDWQLMTKTAKNLLRSSKSGIARVSNILNSKYDVYPDVGFYQVRDLMEGLMEEFEGANVLFKISKNFMFYGSKEGMKTVISNLVRNALKHGGKNVEVAVSATAKYQIIVEDNGQGISPAVIDKLFKERATTEGHGIGLSICKKIVEDHEGSISVESVRNQGTTFTISSQSFVQK